MSLSPLIHSPLFSGVLVYFLWFLQLPPFSCLEHIPPSYFRLDYTVRFVMLVDKDWMLIIQMFRDICLLLGKSWLVGNETLEEDGHINSPISFQGILYWRYGLVLATLATSMLSERVCEWAAVCFPSLLSSFQQHSHAFQHSASPLLLPYFHLLLIHTVLALHLSAR